MQDSNPPQEPLDTPSGNVNNNSQDGHVEIIDRRHLQLLSDAECLHDRYIRDESDETDAYYSMVCANPHCPVGYLVSK